MGALSGDLSVALRVDGLDGSGRIAFLSGHGWLNDPELQPSDSLGRSTLSLIGFCAPRLHRLLRDGAGEGRVA